MRFLLFLLLPLTALAQSPAQANKQLFDRTVDELNFRTFETVYDKHFARQKYPQNLRTAAARKQFTNFENNAELQKLFANYNDVAEHYKAHFGNGPLTQAEFQKQLGGVLRDRNFEFFIRGLPRDEKQGLIRNEERVIKQAASQFNASGSAAPATPQPEEPLAPATEEPLTTHDPDASAAATPGTTAAEEPLTAAEPALRPTAAPTGGGPGWVGYFTLLLSLGSFGLLLYTVASLQPELRRLRRQVRALEATPATFYPEADDQDLAPDEPAPATPRRPSLLSRLRPSKELLTDQYDEDEDEELGEEDTDEGHPRQ